MGSTRALRTLVLAVSASAAGVAAAAGEPPQAGAPPVSLGREFRCELKQQSGLTDADARTATDLVCGELRAASGSAGGYVLTLAALGHAILVVAGRDDGTASLTVQVAGMEEMPLAAQRVAAALAHGRSLASGQRVGNLLESEARQPLTKRGSLKFSATVFDLESPGFGARSVGFALGLVYSTPRYALPVEARFGFGGSSQPDPDLDLAGLSVGARRYFGDRDTAPFVGAGLGVLWLQAAEGGYPTSYGDGSGDSGAWFYADRTSAAAYVEAGVEVLRLHRGRVLLQVRADLPTGWLESPAMPVTCYDPRYCDPRNDHVIPAKSRYVVPVTFGVGVAF